MAKKAAKKRAKKPAKAASAGVTAASAVPRRVSEDFDIMGEGAAAMAQQVQGQLLDQAARRTSNPRPVSYTSADKMQQRLLPLPHFFPQWLNDSAGYPENGVVQFVGDTGCGKSTRVMCDVSHIMQVAHTPVLYVACEGKAKMMSRDRMLRCMHRDPKIARKLLKSIHVEDCGSVVQIMPKLRAWASSYRNAGLPRSIPLLGVLDPYSRLLSNVEAEGNIVWDDLLKESAHEPGDGSNMNHAKNAHALARWLQAFCEMYNVLLFVVHHRTEKVDFSTSAARALQNYSEWKKRLISYNKIGGSGLDGIAAVTVVMTSTETVVNPVTKTATGRKVRARVSKQSHGVSERYGWWELRMEHPDDTPDFLDAPIHYGASFCEHLAEWGQLGVKVGKDGLVSSAELGFRGLTPAMADITIRSKPEVLQALGRTMRINGFFSLVDEIDNPVEAVNGAAA